MPRHNRTKREKQARSEHVARRKRKIKAMINPKKKTRARTKPKKLQEI